MKGSAQGSVAVPESTEKAGLSTRDATFDVYRGLAILCVVMLHVQAVGFNFWDAPAGRWNFWYTLATRQFVLVAVPCFVLMSGYWLGATTFRSALDYRTFLKRRLSRILIPYLIWSLVFIVLVSIHERSFSISGALWKLVLGQAQAQYYFIVMLLQFYVLMPLFSRLADAKHGLRWALLIHLGFGGLLYWSRLYCKGMSSSYYQLPFLAWFLYFYLGVFLRRNPARLDRLSVPLLSVLLGLSVVLSFVESAILLRFDYFEIAVSSYKLSSYGYSTFLLLLLLKLKTIRWPRFLIILGDYSFGLYLIHTVVYRTFNFFAKRVHFLFNVQPLYQVLLTVLTLSVCSGIIWVVRKKLGEKNSRALLGF